MVSQRVRERIRGSKESYTARFPRLELLTAVHRRCLESDLLLSYIQQYVCVCVCMCFGRYSGHELEPPFHARSSSCSILRLFVVYIPILLLLPLVLCSLMLLINIYVDLFSSKYHRANRQSRKSRCVCVCLCS